MSQQQDKERERILECKIIYGMKNGTTRECTKKCVRKIENSTNCLWSSDKANMSNVSLYQVSKASGNASTAAILSSLHAASHKIYPFIAWELEVHNFQWLCKLIFYLTFRHQVSIYLCDNFFLFRAQAISRARSLISHRPRSRSELTFIPLSHNSVFFPSLHACLLRLRLTASITSHIPFISILRFLILPCRTAAAATMTFCVVSLPLELFSLYSPIKAITCALGSDLIRVAI